MAATILAVADRYDLLVVVVVLLEVRMILDCYDGVLARAKKISSPRGRTLDELGDAVSYIALCIGMTVRLARSHANVSPVLVVGFGAVVLATGAMSGHAYDFYKRRLGAALKDGRDAIAEELEQKHELIRRGSAKWITRFGIWFDRWQVRLYEPRYRGNDPVGVIVARAHEPGVGFLVRLIGLQSWDNALALLTLGICFDRVFEAEVLALLYGFTLFTVARITIWRVLGGSEPRPRSKHAVGGPS